MTKHLRGLMTETLRGNFLSFFKKLKAAPTTYAGEKKIQLLAKENSN